MPTHRIFKACLAALALAVLAGCADTHWERTMYEGARHTADQCAIKRSRTDTPCPQLMDYRSYERERAQAKGGTVGEQKP